MRSSLLLSMLLGVTATTLPTFAAVDDGYTSLYGDLSPLSSNAGVTVLGATRFDGENFSTERADLLVATAEPGAVLDDWVPCDDSIEGCVILKIRDAGEEGSFPMLPAAGTYRTIFLTDVPCVDPDADGDGLLEYGVAPDACYGGFLMLGRSETVYSSATNYSGPVYGSFQETQVYLVHHYPETRVATIGEGVGQVSFSYQIPSHSLGFAGDNVTASAIGHDLSFSGFLALAQQSYTLNSITNVVLDADRIMNPADPTGLDPLTLLSPSSCDTLRSEQHDELERKSASLLEANTQQIATTMVSDFDMFAVAGLQLGASLSMVPTVSYVPIDTESRLGDYVAHVLRADRDHGLDDEFDRCVARLTVSPLPFPTLDDLGIEDPTYENAEGEEAEPFTCTQYRVTFKDGTSADIESDYLDDLVGSFKKTCVRWE